MYFVTSTRNSSYISLFKKRHSTFVTLHFQFLFTSLAHVSRALSRLLSPVLPCMYFASFTPILIVYINVHCRVPQLRLKATSTRIIRIIIRYFDIFIFTPVFVWSAFQSSTFYVFESTIDAVRCYIVMKDRFFSLLRQLELWNNAFDCK